MNSTLKSLGGLAISLSLALTGWIVENGVESLSALNPATNLTTFAAAALIGLGVLNAWWTRSFPDAKKVDR